MSVTLTEINQVMQEADLLYTPDQLNVAMDQMAEGINRDLAEANPVVYSVMNGALVLTGHLVTRLKFPLEISYLHATRYRNKTVGSDLDWRAFPAQDVTDRSVLIVDDIYDEGGTLAAIVDHCYEAGARDVKIAVLVNKDHERKVRPEMEVHYEGLKCIDRYIFGFGMDYKGYWRNADGIYAVKGM
ncbi:hypoxanthine-guanine phosphoribosyltransferase [Natronospirillum operosum]|uniref:Hypoxanthine-guanine phosphoribosyltransferase n=1 Tax=Natronospirillum operosum TaxID=2759953 RepID=A0A4Z0W1X3_9GAMM|nr:hypoxanthine-guanine phosphoribosyltransferase [Natronospirillum operosum]TGG90633.1 hypoxanthine-guanine phosphoribosyltransferase [Natronospirillum operosum]